jgi:hypothetical protein
MPLYRFLWQFQLAEEFFKAEVIAYPKRVLAYY